MKKLSIVAVILTALVSCKKETKTVTQIDPKTGDTVQVEVPVEEKASETTLAIVDSAGIFKQSFILEKGKTYPVTGTVTDDTELAEISAGEVKITNFNSKTSFTFENFNLPISANTPDGDGYLEIIAKDKAGNIATKKVSFSIQ